MLKPMLAVVALTTCIGSVAATPTVIKCTTEDSPLESYFQLDDSSKTLLIESGSSFGKTLSWSAKLIEIERPQVSQDRLPLIYRIDRRSGALIIYRRGDADFSHSIHGNCQKSKMPSPKF
jgi:hypothetical protein